MKSYRLFLWGIFIILVLSGCESLEVDSPTENEVFTEMSSNLVLRSATDPNPVKGTIHVQKGENLSLKVESKNSAVKNATWVVEGESYKGAEMSHQFKSLGDIDLKVSTELKNGTSETKTFTVNVGDEKSINIDDVNDLRFEGDTDPNLLYLHGAEDAISIGYSIPFNNYKLTVWNDVDMNDRGIYARGVEVGIHGNALGKGVYGSSMDTGVYGVSTAAGYGVYGKAINVYGSTLGYGILGHENGYGVYGSGDNYDFYADGPGTNYGPFTGGHEVKLSKDSPEDIKPGMVISVTGETQLREGENESTPLSSTLPTVRLSNSENDKKVFGVFINFTSLHEDHWFHNSIEPEDRFATVNALGEGRVLVTNINGEIEAGDYITTSNISGYGMKQDDDLLHNYTLGKATENVDWNKVEKVVEYNGEKYKVYLISVVYTSG